MRLSIPESIAPYELLTPATDAAGRTGLYVSLANAQRAIIVFHVAQGNSGTVLITPLQASDMEGTGSKVLTNNCPIWANLDTATVDYPSRRTDAKNYTTDAGTKNKIVVFQIDPEMLDVANGFQSIGISTGASSASNLTSALVFLEQRYAQVVPPAASDLD